MTPKCGASEKSDIPDVNRLCCTPIFKQPNCSEAHLLVVIYKFHKRLTKFKYIFFVSTFFLPPQQNADQNQHTKNLDADRFNLCFRPNRPAQHTISIS